MFILCWGDCIVATIFMSWWGKCIILRCIWTIEEIMMHVMWFWGRNRPYVLNRDSYVLWEYFIKNCILGKVSSMPELCLTKVIWGSCLVRYLLEYYPYVLTSNDMSKCWELLPKGISNPFSVYGRIFVDGETWILEIDHEWDGGYGCVITQTSRNLSLIVVLRRHVSWRC